MRKYRPEPFLETTEYQRFKEFCDACKEDRYIGLCLGYSGVGKTLAAYNYANWKYFNHFQNPHFAVVDGWDAEILRIADTVVYTPLGSMTANAVLVQILSLISKTESIVFKEVGCADSDEGQVQLVIIDEANRLRWQSLEHIRDLFDQLRIGVVFMGLHSLDWLSKNYATWAFGCSSYCLRDIHELFARALDNLNATSSPSTLSIGENKALLFVLPGYLSVAPYEEDATGSNPISSSFGVNCR